MNTTDIIDLINSGSSITDLVQKTGKSKSTLYLFAKKHGVKILRVDNHLPKAIDVLEKECNTCKVTKDTKEFYAQVKKEKDNIWHYYDPICKECRLRSHREKRVNLKKQALNYLGWECKHCHLVDKDYIQIYDFHHVDPTQKDFTIASVPHKSFDEIKKELDKCIVLCANCHRIEHTLLGLDN